MTSSSTEQQKGQGQQGQTGQSEHSDRLQSTYDSTFIDRMSSEIFGGLQSSSAFGSGSPSQSWGSDLRTQLAYAYIENNRRQADWLMQTVGLETATNQIIQTVVPIAVRQVAAYLCQSPEFAQQIAKQTQQQTQQH
jgi:hypothetical protein